MYLARGYPDTRTVSKSELTEFMRTFYPQVNDVQQARHLAAQRGWYILSGTRNDDRTADIPLGEYKLVSLQEAYPGFRDEQRADPVDPDYWERLKAAYGYRCACCGSKEGEPHLRWPETVTRLEKGHRDPAGRRTGQSHSAMPSLQPGRPGLLDLRRQGPRRRRGQSRGDRPFAGRRPAANLRALAAEIRGGGAPDGKVEPGRKRVVRDTIAGLIIDPVRAW